MREAVFTLNILLGSKLSFHQQDSRWQVHITMHIQDICLKCPQVVFHSKRTHLRPTHRRQFHDPKFFDMLAIQIFQMTQTSDQLSGFVSDPTRIAMEVRMCSILDHDRDHAIEFI